MQASPLGKQPDYETASIFDASPATTAATYEEYLCAYVDYIELIAAVSRCRTQRRIDNSPTSVNVSANAPASRAYPGECDRMTR